MCLYYVQLINYADDKTYVNAIKGDNHLIIIILSGATMQLLMQIQLLLIGINFGYLHE